MARQRGTDDCWLCHSISYIWTSKILRWRKSMPSFEENMKKKLKMKKPRCTSNGERVVRARFVFWEQSPKQPIIPQEQEEAEKKIEVRTLRIQATERMMQLVFAIKQQIFGSCFTNSASGNTGCSEKELRKKAEKEEKPWEWRDARDKAAPKSISVDEHVYDGLNNDWHSIDPVLFTIYIILYSFIISALTGCGQPWKRGGLVCPERALSCMILNHPGCIDSTRELCHRRSSNLPRGDWSLWLDSLSRMGYHKNQPNLWMYQLW